MAAKIATMPKNVVNRKMDNRRFQRVQTLLWARYMAIRRPPCSVFPARTASSRLWAGGIVVLSRQNRVNEAASAFDAAVLKKPERSLSCGKRAAFTIAKGNMNEAEKLLQKAIAGQARDYMAAFYHARGFLMKPAAHPRRHTITSRCFCRCPGRPMSMKRTPDHWAKPATITKPISI